MVGASALKDLTSGRLGRAGHATWDVVNPTWKPRATLTTRSDGNRIDSPLLHITGLALLWISVGLAIATVVEFSYSDPDGFALMASTGIFGGAGYALMRTTKIERLDTAQAFAVVGWTWVIVSLAGAVPYILAGTFQHWDDAIFESVSGFSCTGSTVFFGYNDSIESQGHGILMYRQLTNWAGGMGIVLLAITVLPSLGRGGLGLIGAEAPGPSSDHLVPRLNEMAKRLWYIYLGLTAVMAVAFFAVGMGPFDAVAHSLSTAATGGFSTRNSSIGSFDNIWVEAVACFGMIAGALSFTVHYAAIRRSSKRDVFAHTKDGQTRIYLFGLILAAAAIVTLLWLNSSLSFGDSARAGIFNTVSLGTSTGFGNATAAGSAGDYVTWIPAPQVILLALFVVGGCSGSTAGGVKVIRIQVLWRYVHRVLQRIRHRNLVLPIKVNGGPMAEPLVEKVVGFMALYAVIVAVGIVVVAAMGADLMTAVGGVIGSMGNVGPALNKAGPTASFIDGFSRPARMVLALLMLIGRLEVFPMLLMLVTPRRMWRKVRPREHL